MNVKFQRSVPSGSPFRFFRSAIEGVASILFILVLTLAARSYVVCEIIMWDYYDLSIADGNGNVADG